jgi:hypothetical protein
MQITMEEILGCEAKLPSSTIEGFNWGCGNMDLKNILLIKVMSPLLVG